MSYRERGWLSAVSLGLKPQLNRAIRLKQTSCTNKPWRLEIAPIQTKSAQPDLRQVEGFETHAGGFCLSRRSFNRPVENAARYQLKPTKNFLKSIRFNKLNLLASESILRQGNQKEDLPVVGKGLRKYGLIRTESWNLLLVSFYLLLVAFFFSAPKAAKAVSIDQQLSIPLNNGTQTTDREDADALLRLGGQEEQKGNLEKAIPYWLQALELYQRIGDKEAIGLTYDFLGITYGKLGRYIEAEDALRRRLAVARDRQDFQGQIYGLNNLGTLLLQRSAVDAAIVSFSEAARIAQSIKSLPGEGLSLSNLGLATASAGDYYQAIKRYEEALIFRRRGDDPLGEANTQNNLGDAYLATEKYRDSLLAYRAAQRLGRQTRDRSTQIRAIDGQVAIYSRLRQYPVAFELLDQRLTLAQESQNLRQELRTLALLAQLYQASGNNPTAQTFYERAIILARSLGDEQQEAFLINDLAQIRFTRTK
ncbi:tetratricopeptide repeat protein [Funiculus sociatus GB2-A5]|uniref:Tetratricopeptide repeat protein n=1 Tax=Funiculus sociatus GB2-A5 TaxID=2933946 RepID=A0ABV0JQ20_9CYAN|nr:tetratricopeptide repeat protein [Trichocoleus sp. FACHB-6]MBD2061807.1 tetratricopeptide repeat protein [Trichocoleus sp. FACHB-6]